MAAPVNRRVGPSSHRVCLIHPNKAAYSETFIRNHLEKLPAEIDELCGGWFPTRRGDGRRLLSLPVAIAGKLGERLPAGVRALSDRIRDRRLANYLKSRSIEAVLAEYGPTGVSVMNSCRFAEVPLVVHFHGFDAHDKRTLETYGESYRKMLSCADAVVAVSRHMQRQLIELGGRADKVHYSPYGVDCSLFEGARPGDAPPTFLAVGRFVDKKAPHLTILAFSKTVGRVPDARLVLIGDGELLESCRQLAVALKLTGKVDFRGAQSNRDVAAAMRTCRAFVQHSVETSYGDSEGTPVTILEAGATGLPVVATRHAGIRDVVREGETGFLVAERDIDAMADRMTTLADSPSLAATLGMRARQHVAANFALSRSIDRLWTILRDAIEARR